MPVFFPDNVNRRDRALQLQNDIIFLQDAAAKAKDAMDKQDARMVPYINEILESNGLSSFDDLQEKLNDVLTPEQQKMYSDLVKNSAEVQSGNKIAITVIGVMALTSGGLAIANLIRVGALMDILRGFARAFITLVTEGVAAGIRAFGMVSTAFRWAIEGTQNTAEGAQIAGYAASATRYLGFLAIAGILADGFIMAYAYYEEKEQKEDLDKAIKELYINRNVAKVYGKMCDAIKTQDGLMLSYLLVVNEDPSSAASIATSLVNNVKSAWTTITTKTALNELIVLDSGRRTWTSSDPSYDDAVAGAEDKIKADPPHAGPTAAKLSSTRSVKTAALEVAKAADDFWPSASIHHLSAALVHLHDRKNEKVRARLERGLSSALLVF